MSLNGQINVIWEGPQLVNSSLGLVNRYLCSELLDFQNFHLKPLPIEKDSIPDTWFSGTSKLTAAYYNDVPHADVHIRLQWPPSFQDMRGSHFVMLQPWEYGPIPKSWIDPINQSVDEIWVSSEYTKQGYVRSGIPSERVFVFPLGFDPEIYHPEGPRLAIKTNKRFKFLFVGGTIYRKGIDKVLEAYAKSFTDKDDICLVIKDHGTKTHYQGQTQIAQIQALQSTPNAPEILYMDNEMSPSQLAALYRSCDCLVHPYRGEGFGLPILEAMACGLPPIIPNLGPAVEYTTESSSFRTPSDIEYIDSSNLDTVLPVELISVDIEALSQIMRTCYETPKLVTKKGQSAASQSASLYTWAKVANYVRERIELLAGIPETKVKPIDDLGQVFRRIAHQFEGTQNVRKQLYSQLVRCFTQGDSVIDLGAGDGTWLHLLRDFGVNGVGVDLDPVKVSEMKACGLNAVHADVLEYANNLTSYVDGLTMLHIIEHMNPEQAVRIIRSISAKFTYRGRILIVTPNFSNPVVSQMNFWLDVTHIRPYPAELLQAILTAIGFRTIISATMNNEMDTVVFGSMLLNDNPFSELHR